MEFLKTPIDFLFDKKRRIGHKTAVVILFVVGLFLIDDVFGFSYFYSNSKKISQASEVSHLLNEKTLDPASYTLLVKKRSEIIERHSNIQTFGEWLIEPVFPNGTNIPHDRAGNIPRASTSDPQAGTPDPRGATPQGRAMPFPGANPLGVSPAADDNTGSRSTKETNGSIGGNQPTNQAGANQTNQTGSGSTKNGTGDRAAINNTNHAPAAIDNTGQTGTTIGSETYIGPGGDSGDPGSNSGDDPRSASEYFFACVSLAWFNIAKGLLDVAKHYKHVTLNVILRLIANTTVWLFIGCLLYSILTRLPILYNMSFNYAFVLMVNVFLGIWIHFLVDDPPPSKIQPLVIYSREEYSIY
jgi:hypothetical protein